MKNHYNPYKVYHSQLKDEFLTDLSQTESEPLSEQSVGVSELFQADGNEVSL